ncbi:hypothetical protein OsI_06999 [Oryza sativa Indica Group]|nr:hypothetical protein OsI_06999 [Oryza sativa Indica Group]
MLFYPTVVYNVVKSCFEPHFYWWDQVDMHVLLSAHPCPSNIMWLKKLGVYDVVTLSESYERLVCQAHGIENLVLPTRGYLHAPSFENLCQTVVSFTNLLKMYILWYDRITMMDSSLMLITCQPLRPQQARGEEGKQVLQVLGVMEAVTIMAIALANGGGKPPNWQDFVGIITLLIINSTISFIENNVVNAAAALMARVAPRAKSFLMSFNFAYSEGGQISEHVAQERWQQQLELCDGEQGRRPASGGERRSLGK